ncbi:MULTISPECIES: hypothetical protein [unclassified Marinobacter]|uniref:hypothetical protein n=1 Tax=unclassified Marinobacter TaxID=83889 RepID=UPI0019293814|nr:MULTISPECIES: hypothetical protein [unclassified Marinobacter]MBL3825875.1 hypothetical protein [Marinobacter sp. MC3]MBL3894550.1 hypothetical protein [Marinobacter sp. MW3]
MEEIVGFLDKWQTLAGATISGIIALLVALLVAYKARRQEDLSAAMLLVGNLVAVRTASRALEDLAKEESISNENLPYWLSEKLVRRRIALSPMFEASRIRLMPVDVRLAAHLELFQMIFTDIEAKLDMLTNDFAAFDAVEQATRDPEVLKADCRAIQKGFVTAVAHAKCAERILTLKVLSNWPTFHTVRMMLKKTSEERACKNRLERP